MRKFLAGLLLLATSLAIGGNNSGWTNSGGSLSTQAKSVGVAAVAGGGTFLFQDDFKSSSGTTYSWGTLPMTSKSTFCSQAGSNWQYCNDMDLTGTNQGGIDAWPPDTSKNAFFMKYIGDGDTNVIAHKFDPNHTIDTGRPTEIYVQWKEYRTSTFDCAPEKDARIGIFTAGHWADSHDQTSTELYWGVGTGSPTTGNDACTGSGMYLQGDWNSTDFPANDVWSTTTLSYSKGAAHTWEMHVKVNTPGNHDGALQMWIDSVSIGSATNIKFTNATRDALGQSYLDNVQLGMAATNGGL